MWLQQEQSPCLFQALALLRLKSNPHFPGNKPTLSQLTGTNLIHTFLWESHINYKKIYFCADMPRTVLQTILPVPPTNSLIQLVFVDLRDNLLHCLSACLRKKHHSNLVSPTQAKLGCFHVRVTICHDHKRGQSCPKMLDAQEKSRTWTNKS